MLGFHVHHCSVSGWPTGCASRPGRGCRKRITKAGTYRLCYNVLSNNIVDGFVSDIRLNTPSFDYFCPGHDRTRLQRRVRCSHFGSGKGAGNSSKGPGGIRTGDVRVESTGRNEKTQRNRLNDVRSTTVLGVRYFGPFLTRTYAFSPIYHPPPSLLIASVTRGCRTYHYPGAVNRYYARTYARTIWLN